MKIYFFCKTIPIHSKYARMKLHIGKTNPETKKRQQKVFFVYFWHIYAREVTPTILFLLLEHMANFGLRLYNLPFLFNLNKNISKTLTEVNKCLKPFGKHCLKKKKNYLRMCFVYIGFEIINNVQGFECFRSAG